MGMPKKEACENSYLWMPDDNGASHFCYRGCSKLDSANELWKAPSVNPLVHERQHPQAAEFPSVVSL